jgi:hypothetical protein
MLRYNLQTKDLVIIALLMVLSLFQFKSCNHNNELALMENNLLDYQDSIKTYRAKNGDLLEYNKAVYMSYNNSSAEINKLKKELDFKRVDVLVKYKSVFKHDTIQYKFITQLPCDSFNELVSIDSAYFKLNISLSNASLRINSIDIPNAQSFVIGEKKNGLFKANEFSVVVSNSNPHIKGESLSAYTFKPKPKWYNSIGFKGAVFVAGVVGGVILAK